MGWYIMKNIFIFGSCVTRDAFTPANTNEFCVSGYIARHSLARFKHAVFNGINLQVPVSTYHKINL